MTAPSDRAPDHLAERRKNPRAGPSARLKRLRGEAAPPRALADAAEGLFRWIHLVARELHTAISDLGARRDGNARGVSGKEIPRL